MQFNGDLEPVASGVGDIGATEIPVIRVFQESGVFYAQGASGIFRFDGDQQRMQASNDGGTSYFNIPTTVGGGGVDSLGVVGWSNLTGDVDLNSPSGYIIMTQAGQVISMDIDLVGISGFYGMQSFDNIVTSFSKNGSSLLVDDVTISEGSLGLINLTQAAQDVAVEIDTAALSGHYAMKSFDNIPACYSEVFGSAVRWTVNHNLGTEKLIVNVWDDSGNLLKLIPDTVTAMTVDQIQVNFGVAQGGTVVIMGCP
jgi:hypothetical protein